jgi:hypothetical protein
MLLTKIIDFFVSHFPFEIICFSCANEKLVEAFKLLKKRSQQVQLTEGEL